MVTEVRHLTLYETASLLPLCSFSSFSSPSLLPSSLPTQEKLTLQRRKKRQEAAETQADITAQENADYTDKAELDDLIAVLKSGEYFDRRRGQRRHSGVSLASCGNTPRNSRVFEFSRDRSQSQVSITDSSAKQNS